MTADQMLQSLNDCRPNVSGLKWSQTNNLKLNVLKSKKVIFQNSRRRTTVTPPQPLPNISRENVLKILGITILQTICLRQNISVGLSATAYNRCMRFDWDRPTCRLPSGRRVAHDVCITSVERVHHGDGPPTRRRISHPQQAMWLLLTWPARLRSAVRGGSRSTVWENIEQSTPHTISIGLMKRNHGIDYGPVPVHAWSFLELGSAPLAIDHFVWLST